MRLVLVRHGQTPSNVLRALDSRPPGPPLTELGRAQAAALGERLATWDVESVHASHALRAQQTAAPVAAAHGLELRLAAGVHEVDCGDLEGRSDPEARRRFDEVYDSWWRGELDARLPGGESAHDLRARFLPTVDRLVVAATGDVVLVSHGAALRLAAAALLGDTAETWYVPNTGVVVLRPGPSGPGAVGEWELEHWDPAPPVGPPHPADTPAAGD